VNSCVQVAENPQVVCTSYVNDAHATDRRVQQDEALQERRVHHGEVLRPGQPNAQAPEALAAEMDALVLNAGEREGVQNGAGGDQVVQVQFSHVDAYQLERPEMGKEDAGEAVGELPEGQGEALERRAAEDVGRKAHGFGRVPGSRRAAEVGKEDCLVEEGELLGALGGEEARPVGELTVQIIESALAEADGAEGATVISEDSSDAGGTLELGKAGIVEDEQGGAPEVAPAGGESGGAGAIRDGELGDDVTEEVVVEGVDSALAVAAAGC
jgi:hypothetical protein